MRYDKLFTKLFCQPLVLEASFRRGLEMALFSLMKGEVPVTPPMVKKIDPELGQARSERILEIRGSTAIIHIDGVIDKNLTWMDRISFNATDLNDIDRALAQVRDDSSIKNLMLAVDSPGGSVPGTPETAARIDSLAGKKNVAAYLDNGCSGAYWIASQCTEIYAAPSSNSGSVGVYLALLDESRYLDDLGVKIETLQAGKLKTAGAPWKPLTESEREYLQNRVDQIADMFYMAVTTAREIDVSALEGQAFLGQAALEAGIVDYLCGSLDEAIDRAF